MRQEEDERKQREWRERREKGRGEGEVVTKERNIESITKPLLLY